MRVTILALGAAGAIATCSLAFATAEAMRVRRRLPVPVRGRVGADHRGGRGRDGLSVALGRADVPLDAPSAVRLAGSAVVAAGGLGLVLGGAVLAVCAAVVVALAGPVALLAMQGRRDRRADDGLPIVLDDIARRLRGGAAPTAALAGATDGRGATAARADVSAVVADVRAGLGLVDVLERWSARRPSRAVRLVVGALAIGVTTGGARSQAVEAVAATLREQHTVEREARALAAQARSSAVVIAVAPLAFALLAGISDPRAASFLVRTPVGLACLAGGLVLDALGAWWMRRIVRLA